MIDRMQLGLVPEKPHTVFRNSRGELLFEHCFTRQGFEGAFSILYHEHHPSIQTGHRASARGWPKAQAAPADVLLRRHYLSPKLPVGGRMLDARTPLLFNNDVTLLVARPTEDDDLFFSNGDGDELHYVHEGAGTLETALGLLPFKAGDYVLLPRAVMHRWTWKTPGYVLTALGHGFIDVPRNFRNAYGQLRMDAPYTHRDFGRPLWPEGGIARYLQNAPRTVVVRRGGRFFEYDSSTPPLDVVGWDGVVWPFTFDIEKFQPKTGSVHLPPTIHTTFAGNRFVVCSFVPRRTDFHPDAIPCPYPHSSVDCDEVIFYVRGNFTSRKGVGPGSVSLHPAGIVHGPHPGAYEKSIGTTHTEELAVMFDTFVPLEPTRQALEIEDRDYMASWEN